MLCLRVLGQGVCLARLWQYFATLCAWWLDTGSFYWKMFGRYVHFFVFFLFLCMFPLVGPVLALKHSPLCTMRRRSSISLSVNEAFRLLVSSSFHLAIPCQRGTSHAKAIRTLIESLYAPSCASLLFNLLHVGHSHIQETTSLYFCCLVS
jgi:hypothetical protein